jgi:hypothetical protein
MMPVTGSGSKWSTTKQSSIGDFLNSEGRKEAHLKAIKVCPMRYRKNKNAHTKYSSRVSHWQLPCT